MLEQQTGQDMNKTESVSGDDSMEERQAFQSSSLDHMTAQFMPSDILVVPNISATHGH